MFYDDYIIITKFKHSMTIFFVIQYGPKHHKPSARMAIL